MFQLQYRHVIFGLSFLQLSVCPTNFLYRGLAGGAGSCCSLYTISTAFADVVHAGQKHGINLCYEANNTGVGLVYGFLYKSVIHIYLFLSLKSMFNWYLCLPLSLPGSCPGQLSKREREREEIVRIRWRFTSEPFLNLFLYLWANHFGTFNYKQTYPLSRSSFAPFLLMGEPFCLEPLLLMAKPILPLFLLNLKKFGPSSEHNWKWTDHDWK